MPLHHSLRELVSVRGAGVVDEAEEFRGVLDDFLAEDEATLGELNLLVDAVRLGALRRVLDVMANGAEPHAAIREAGVALARDRGTDDPTRSCWALASLCFALGKVDESSVRTFLGATGTLSVPDRPSGPAAPPPGAAAGSSTAERPATEVLPGQSAPEALPPTAPAGAAPPTGAPYAGPVPPVIREERSSRAGLSLLLVLVALLVGGLVATGIILLRSGDDPTASDDPTSTRAGGDDGDGGAEGSGIAETEMLVSFKIGEGEEATASIYAIDVDGTYREVTDGSYDVLPTLSPDRRTLTYGQGPPPLTQIRWDVGTAAFEPFFSQSGPCDRALRPGWSPDGSQVALVCTGVDEEPDGLYLADADGSDLRVYVENPLVKGAPTWVSDDEFIFGLAEDTETEELRLWRGFADGSPEVPLEIDAGEGQSLTHADWSAEAQKLLFLVCPAGGPEIGSVWMADRDGSDAEVVAEGSYSHPVWSPTGDSIAMTVVDPETDTETLAYFEVGDDPLAQPQIPPDLPPGGVGAPVWDTR